MYFYIFKSHISCQENGIKSHHEEHLRVSCCWSANEIHRGLLCMAQNTGYFGPRGLRLMVFEDSIDNRDRIEKGSERIGNYCWVADMQQWLSS